MIDWPDQKIGRGRNRVQRDLHTREHSALGVGIGDEAGARPRRQLLDRVARCLAASHDCCAAQGLELFQQQRQRGAARHLEQGFRAAHPPGLPGRQHNGNDRRALFLWARAGHFGRLARGTRVRQLWWKTATLVHTSRYTLQVAGCLRFYAL